MQNSARQYLIIRSSWVYSFRRTSFPTKVLRWARYHGVMKVVDDQVDIPDWTRSPAEAAGQLLARGHAYGLDSLAERLGVYLLAGDGHTTRLY